MTIAQSLCEISRIDRSCDHLQSKSTASCSTLCVVDIDTLYNGCLGGSEPSVPSTSNARSNRDECICARLQSFCASLMLIHNTFHMQ